MRGSYVRAEESLETANSDVDGGEAKELYDGLAERDGECCHGVKPPEVYPVHPMRDQ